MTDPQTVQPRRIAVVLVDDHPIFREGLLALLKRQTDVAVVGEAGDGREGVRLARSLQPTVVSMNVTMPALNGIDATRQITSELAGVKVLGLSQHRDRRIVGGMLAAGASGYVVKDCSFGEYLDALRAVADGHTYLSGSVAESLVRDYLGARSPDRGPLSAREREVLQLIAEGCPTSEVARQLHISTKTVDTHRRQIMEKLGARSIAQLTKYAIREGITSLE